VWDAAEEEKVEPELERFKRADIEENEDRARFLLLNPRILAFLVEPENIFPEEKRNNAALVLGWLRNLKEGDRERDIDRSRVEATRRYLDRTAADFHGNYRDLLSFRPIGPETPREQPLEAIPGFTLEDARAALRPAEESEKQRESRLARMQESIRIGDVSDRVANEFRMEEKRLGVEIERLNRNLMGKTQWSATGGVQVDASAAATGYGVFLNAFVQIQIDWSSDAKLRYGNLRVRWAELQQEILRHTMEVEAAKLYFEFLVAVNRIHELQNNRERVTDYYSRLAAANAEYNAVLSKFPPEQRRISPRR
jgi:hypothetical protein